MTNSKPINKSNCGESAINKNTEYQIPYLKDMPQFNKVARKVNKLCDKNKSIEEVRNEILSLVEEEYNDKAHKGCGRYIGCVCNSDTLRKKIDNIISIKLQNKVIEEKEKQYEIDRKYLDKVIDDNKKLLMSFYKSKDINKLVEYVENNLLVNC